MSPTRMLKLAVAASLVSFTAAAESLTVGPGETVEINESKRYDSVTLNGGTVRLGTGGVLRGGGVDIGASDSTIEFNGGKLEDRKSTRLNSSHVT